MDINITISKREKDLIYLALNRLHAQMSLDDIDLESEIREIPDDEEVWNLKEKIKGYL